MFIAAQLGVDEQPLKFAYRKAWKTFVCTHLFINDLRSYPSLTGTGNHIMNDSYDLVKP